MTSTKTNPWRQEFIGLTRALCGAFLFGMPLLFTMEMWWIAEFASIGKILTLLALAFLVNIHLAYVSGFKDKPGLLSAIDQAIDAVAVGIIASIILLLALNRITISEPLSSIASKIIIQVVPLSIGASVANFFFPRKEGRMDTRNGNGDSKPKHPPAWLRLLDDVGATMSGGIFLGFSIAPTEEIPMLAIEINLAHQISLIFISLAISFAVVFVSGFSQPQKGEISGIFHRPFSETALAYLISLGVAFVALYLFDQIDFRDPLSHTISQILILALPTSVGGAAGRLII